MVTYTSGGETEDREKKRAEGVGENVYGVEGISPRTIFSICSKRYLSTSCLMHGVGVPAFVASTEVLI